MTAALFVAANGPYVGLEGVDPWTKARDARKYAGPWPVVAHPPCERWGRYATGGPNPKAKRRKFGDDGGCFKAALAAVLEWGGVLEHPADSGAWAAFGLPKPPKDGGWVADLFRPLWTCHVEQGNYGHRARKATWLCAKSETLPDLKWGPSTGLRLEEGFHSSGERARARALQVSRRSSEYPNGIGSTLRNRFEISCFKSPGKGAGYDGVRVSFPQTEGDDAGSISGPVVVDSEMTEMNDEETAENMALVWDMSADVPVYHRLNMYQMIYRAGVLAGMKAMRDKTTTDNEQRPRRSR